MVVSWERRTASMQMQRRATAHSSFYVKSRRRSRCGRCGQIRRFEAAQRFASGLAFGLFALVVGASGGVAGRLGQGDEVDDPTALSVAAAVQSMAVGAAGADGHGCGAVGHREIARAEAGDVAGSRR
jgi:hypothetical protein